MSTKINPILLDPAGAADGAALVYNSASGVAWGVPVSAGGGTEAYANVASLPLANNTTGSLAYVEATNRLYIWTGVGWFNIALINTNPTITSGPDASYDFALDGTPIVLTLVASDPEGIPITWSSQVTTGTLGNTAVITQNNNVFTITPSTVEDDGGSFIVTFTASDGVNIATAASSFTLAFELDWSLVTQQAKLVASDAQASDTFGRPVSIDGDTIVVGARNEDQGGSDAGAAYVFARSGTTWTQQAKLVASDAQASDQFGFSVSIDGDTIVVGAPDEDQGGLNAGAAYVFTRSGTTWTQQAKLIASDAQTTDTFGGSVSIDGDTIVVGARNEDPSGVTDAGSAYVFTRSGTTWTQQAKLVASDAQSSDLFGESVSIDGDTIVVGAYLEDQGGSDAGAAYVFARSGTTWTQQAKLVASDAQSNDQFGFSVSIDGDTIVVSAHLGGPGGINLAGAAYVFTRSGTTWTQQAKLVASDAQSNDRLGISVSIDGDTIVVGAFLEDPSGVTDAGSAYLFTRSGTTWTQQAKLVASDAQASDLFGESVSIDGDTIVVGAYLEDPSGVTNAGSAYVFTA